MTSWECSSGRQNVVPCRCCVGREDGRVVRSATCRGRASARARERRRATRGHAVHEHRAEPAVSSRLRLACGMIALDCSRDGRGCVTGGERKRPRGAHQRKKALAPKGDVASASSRCSSMSRRKARASLHGMAGAGRRRGYGERPLIALRTERGDGGACTPDAQRLRPGVAC